MKTKLVWSYFSLLWGKVLWDCGGKFTLLAGDFLHKYPDSSRDVKIARNVRVCQYLAINKRLCKVTPAKYCELASPPRRRLPVPDWGHEAGGIGAAALDDGPCTVALHCRTICHALHTASVAGIGSRWYRTSDTLHWLDEDAACETRAHGLVKKDELSQQTTCLNERVVSTDEWSPPTSCPNSVLNIRCLSFQWFHCVHPFFSFYPQGPVGFPGEPGEIGQAGQPVSR